MVAFGREATGSVQPAMQPGCYSKRGLRTDERAAAPPVSPRRPPTVRADASRGARSPSDLHSRSLLNSVKPRRVLLHPAQACDEMIEIYLQSCHPDCATCGVN